MSARSDELTRGFSQALCIPSLQHVPFPICFGCRSYHVVPGASGPVSFGPPFLVTSGNYLATSFDNNPCKTNSISVYIR